MLSAQGFKVHLSAIYFFQLEDNSVVFLRVFCCDGGGGGGSVGGREAVTHYRLMVIKCSS